MACETFPTQVRDQQGGRERHGRTAYLQLIDLNGPSGNVVVGGVKVLALGVGLLFLLHLELKH